MSNLSTKERIDAIYKDVSGKMVELINENQDSSYLDISKKCVQHFVKSYNEHRDNTYGFLITDYQVGKIFAEYLFNKEGFKDFFMNKPVNSVTEETEQKQEKQEIMNETKVLEIDKENVLKGFRKYMSEEPNLNRAVDKIVLNGKIHNMIPEETTEGDIYTILAEYFFEQIKSMNMDLKSHVISKFKHIDRSGLQEIYDYLDNILNN